MDLTKIVKKRAKLIKAEKKVYYRSDSSKDFSISSVKMDLRKKNLAQFKHAPSQVMTYLPGVFATPSIEYAKKYPQDNLFSFEFTGKIFEIPRDFIRVKGQMNLAQFLEWLKDNSYDAVLGINAANTNFGNFDEIVILNKAKITNIKEMGK